MPDEQGQEGQEEMPVREKGDSFKLLDDAIADKKAAEVIRET